MEQSSTNSATPSSSSNTSTSTSTTKKIRAPRVKKDKSANALNSLQADVSTSSSIDPVKVQVTLSEAEFERFKQFRSGASSSSNEQIPVAHKKIAKTKRPVDWAKLSASEVPRRRGIGKVTAGASPPYQKAKSDPAIYASLVEEALKLTAERAAEHKDLSKKPRKVSTWAVYQKRNPSLFDALRTKKAEGEILSQGTVA